MEQKRSRRTVSRKRSFSQRRRRANSDIRLLKKKLLKLDMKQEAQTEFKSQGICKQHEFNINMKAREEEAFASNIPENGMIPSKKVRIFWQERQHCSRWPFSQSTGNDISGPLFSPFFSFLLLLLLLYHNLFSTRKLSPLFIHHLPSGRVIDFVSDRSNSMCNNCVSIPPLSFRGASA